MAVDTTANRVIQEVSADAGWVEYQFMLGDFRYVFSAWELQSDDPIAEFFFWEEFEPFGGDDNPNGCRGDGTPPPPTGLVGSWGFSVDFDTDAFHEVFLTFHDDGNYSIEEVLATPAEGEVSGGIEHGTYEWNPDTGLLTFTVGEDGNGTLGFSDGIAEIVIMPSTDGFSATLEAKDANATVVILWGLFRMFDFQP